MKGGKRKKRVSTVGRRTGVDVVADKRIKLQVDGFEDFNGYWTPSECSSISGNSPEKPIHSSPKISNVQRISSFIKSLPSSDKSDVRGTINFTDEPNSSSFISSNVSRKDNSYSLRNCVIEKISTPDNTIVEGNSPALKKISENRKIYAKGRRTGVDMFRGKNINVDNGVEDYEGYWTDTHSGVTTVNRNETYVCDSIPSTPKSKSTLRIDNNEVQNDSHHNVTFQSPAISSTMITPTKSNSSVKYNSPQSTVGDQLTKIRSVSPNNESSVALRKVSPKCKSPVSLRKGSPKCKSPMSLKKGSRKCKSPMSLRKKSFMDKSPVSLEKGSSNSKSPVSLEKGLSNSKSPVSLEKSSSNNKSPVSLKKGSSNKSSASLEKESSNSMSPVSFKKGSSNKSSASLEKGSSNSMSPVSLKKGLSNKSPVSLEKESSNSMSPVPLEKGSLNTISPVSLEKGSSNSMSPVSLENRSSNNKTPVSLEKGSSNNNSVSLEKWSSSNNSVSLEKGLSNNKSPVSFEKGPSNNNSVSLEKELSNNKSPVSLEKGLPNNKSPNSLEKGSSKNKSPISLEERSPIPKYRNRKRAKTTLHRNVAEANTENLNVQSGEAYGRRSARTKVCPLEYWRSERRQFNNRTGQVILEKGTDDFIAERLSNKYARNAKRRKTEEVKVKLRDNSVNLNHVQNTVDKIAVTNPNTGEEEYVYLYRPYNSLLWSHPQSQDPNNPSYQVTKCIAGELISFGYIDINVKQKKEKQYSPTYNITFSIVKGQVRVTVNKSKIKLKELDTITIPFSNTYSIHNIGNKNAVLFFCTFKAPLFDYQIATSHV